jgi:hypothetical protein
MQWNTESEREAKFIVHCGSRFANNFDMPAWIIEVPSQRFEVLYQQNWHPFRYSQLRILRRQIAYLDSFPNTKIQQNILRPTCNSFSKFVRNYTGR